MTARKRKAWAPKADPVTQLSFVADREPSEAKKHKFPRNFWNVTPMENHVADSAFGQKLALEYLEFETRRDHNVYPCLLPWIVADMPRKLSPVEVAFLTVVGFASIAGTEEGRRIVDYWSRARRVA